MKDTTEKSLYVSTYYVLFNYKGKLKSQIENRYKSCIKIEIVKLVSR